MKKKNNCFGCYECRKDIKIGTVFGQTFTEGMTRMFICSDCGNKRCPKATDHRLTCTNSNEEGQLGSKYGIYPHPCLELLEFIHSKS